MAYIVCMCIKFTNVSFMVVFWHSFVVYLRTKHSTTIWSRNGEMNGHDYKCHSFNKHDLTCPLMWLAEKQFIHILTCSISSYSGAVNCCILIAVRCHWLKVKTAYLLGIRCSMCLSCDDRYCLNLWIYFMLTFWENKIK